VYVIGMPGVGKSTAVATAMDLLGWQVTEERATPFAHTVYDSGAIQLGRNRAHFSGTDALSMSVSPLAVEFMRTLPAPLVLGEGDRLGTAKFLLAVAVMPDVILEVVHLEAPPQVAWQRASDRGSAQSWSWWRGRATKVRNLTHLLPCLTIDAARPPGAVAQDLAAVLAAPVGTVTPA